MNQFNCKNAEDICNGCLAIGRKLGSLAITQAGSEGLRQLQHSSKMRAAFISSRFQGLADALEEVFSISALPGDMNSSSVRSSVCIRYVHSDTETTDDVSAAQQLAGGEQPVHAVFQSASENLEKMDAELICDVNGFEDFDWKKEFAEIDYAFLVTSAVQMLTAKEREFVEQCVKRYFGLPRFAILVTDMGMINDPEAYEELKSRLDWYLDSLGRQCRSFEAGDGSLKQYIFDNLTNVGEELRNLSALQTAKLCCDETAEVLNEMQQHSAVDIEELESYITQLQKCGDGMRRKGAIAANNVHGELTGKAAFECITAVRKYGSQMYVNICEGIGQSSDLDKTARMIPDFISSAWKQLSVEQTKKMRSTAENIVSEMEEQMRLDAGEFFTDVPEWALDMICMQPAVPDRVELPQGETENKINRISKALLIGSVPVLILGSLPLALGTLIGSQAIKKLSREKIQAENREVLKREAHEICQRTTSELSEELKAALIDIAEKAEKDIKSAYDGFVSAVLNELVKQKESAQQVYGKMEEIRQAAQVDLPRLYAMISD
ncbi:hypothetical protein [Murimonas intestini]|uniref:Dynamin n=1 Tax=Murimonas intestini TaxID=1337051 RepID=A0AB73T133_9FIRM|nr:hypothetical protein [Murimonas intestini]MCR1840377.1 hypothetical protein [Murimonas intestini]MCR1867512.1 hypothetical protein [Murimonas intestini]MCR1884699.1 hypothetical protein [Murimonas intestini]